MGEFTHVATFTWKPGVTEAQRAELEEALARLPGLIPTIRSYRFGADVGLSPGNDDFAVMARFDDVDAFRAYAADPRHREIIERLLMPILEARHAVQFSGPERALPPQ